MKREHYQVILLIFMEDNSFLYKKKAWPYLFSSIGTERGSSPELIYGRGLGKTLHNHMIRVMKDDNFLVRMFLEASIE